ncbi:MAG: flagellar M-ring protein FliF [Bdellovibrionaceae bacterium]|nr:flagellar M-ring protein FliF [Pseudobdellovibrionaceae bacterium]
MLEYFKKVGVQIFDFLDNLSVVKKVAVLGTLVAIAGTIAAMFHWAGQESFKPLMTNLAPDDSAAIIRVLRDKNIPFRVEEGGKNISIPPERVYDLRLELATLGMPQSGVIGYEVFDKQALGTTSFVQKLNRKRALEGELIRTIRTIKGVKRARVHLAIPKKSAFLSESKPPSASVVVDLEPGFKLNEKQIHGIGVMVSSAVSGLEISAVAIVDSSGRQLSKATHDPLVALSATQHEYKRKVETDLEDRVIRLLEPIVGEGRVVARISTEIDFSEIVEDQTIYDPDGAAVSSQEKLDNSANGERPSPVGAAGATANLPGEDPANNNIKTNTTNVRSITNYSVPKTVKRTRKQVGKVEKISVAVVLDNQQIKEKDKDGKVLAKSVPWSPEKLSELQGIISKALGLDSKRGDSIDLKSMSFTREDFEEAQRLIEENERRDYIENLILYSVIGLIILLFFFFVVRPFIKWITENTIDSVDSFLPQTIEELERMQRESNLPGLEEAMPVLPEKIDPDKVEGEMIKEKIITLVDSNPSKAALILRDWVKIEKPSKDEADQAGA